MQYQLRVAANLKRQQYITLRQLTGTHHAHAVTVDVGQCPTLEPEAEATGQSRIEVAPEIVRRKRIQVAHLLAGLEARDVRIQCRIECRLRWMLCLATAQ